MNIKKAYIILGLLVMGGLAWGQSGSVLSEGHWWKVGIEEEGVYRLTTREIPDLRGVAVGNIGMYGAGGGMLSTRNSETPTSDLSMIGITIVDKDGDNIFEDEDELLFFGEGASGWQYDSDLRRWVYGQHAYAKENYYIVTTAANNSQRIEIVSGPTVWDTVVREQRVVAHHEEELVNMFKTGQTWLGEKMSTAVAERNVDVRLEGSNVRNVKLRWAVASSGTTRAQFRLSTTGMEREETTTIQSPYKAVTDAMGVDAGSYRFTLRFSASDNAGVGYLDFIELNGLASMTFTGGQKMVRQDQHLGGTVRMEMTGLESDVRVWEVTKAGAEREMTVNAGGWADSMPTAKRYVVFDSYSYMTPHEIIAIDNQNLHGADAAMLVVVTKKKYKEQAERLAGLHELFDGMSTLVATDEEVFNEYSSGKQDPMALRSLLRDLKERHPGEAPRWMVLLGKGTYDNRHLLGSATETLVTYETPFSFDEDGASFASDDMMGYLAATGRGTSSETLDVSVGRLPARDVDEATHLVDKIEHYLTRRDLMDENNRGDWRNYVALLADDADPGRPGDTVFAHSSEVIATSIKETLPQMNIDRLYADAYHQESGAIGSYYPDLNNALRRRMDYGCLLLNYIGHGSTVYIGTERYIEPSDITAYSNEDRLPMFVTSTCSYGRYDMEDELSGAEACVLAPAAMIGVISASRPISHIERFNKDVVLFALNPENTIGDALRKAKNRTPVSMSIGLIGDPALRLSQPENRVKVTHINMEEVNDTTDVTAEVLSTVTVKGEIVDKNGNLISDFDGMLYPIVFDREMRSTTLANDNAGTAVPFHQQKTVLYKGSHTVENGRFEYSFIVPRDVPYEYAYAKLSHYAKSETEHATGCFLRLKLGGMNEVAIDTTLKPEIKLYMGDTNFRPGGLTGSSPTLLAQLSDSAGINIGTGLGHDITAVIDGNANSLIVLNDLYEQDIEDSRRGSVSYQLQNLAPGRHTVTVKAWNIFGTSGSATVAFTVYGEDTLNFSELDCMPNPATTEAHFELRVNNPTTIKTCELQIYNARGQAVYSCTPSISATGYLLGPVVWNVSTVPSGLYLARMVVTDNEGEIHQVVAKCIVR